MDSHPLLLTLAAAAALAGCNKESHTIVAGPDTGEKRRNSAANANVQLPPSILPTKLYRCADNSVVTVDWLSDNKSANVRADKGARPSRSRRPSRPADDGRRRLFGRRRAGRARRQDRRAGTSRADLQSLTSIVHFLCGPEQRPRREISDADQQARIHRRSAERRARQPDRRARVRAGPEVRRRSGCNTSVRPGAPQAFRPSGHDAGRHHAGRVRQR